MTLMFIPLIVSDRRTECCKAALRKRNLDLNNIMTVHSQSYYYCDDDNNNGNLVRDVRCEAKENILLLGPGGGGGRW